MNINRLKLFLKCVVTIGLLGWLVTFLIQSESMNILAKVDVPFFLLACLLHLVAYIILLNRWRYVLAIYYNVSCMSIAASFFIGLFANNFLPGSVGGDLVRTSYLYKQGLALSEVLASAVLDRFVGLIVILSLSICGILLLSLDQFVDNIHHILYWGIILLLFPVACYLLLKQLINHVTWLKKAPLLFNALVKFKELMKTVKAQPHRLLVTALFSVASTGCIILCFYSVAIAVNITVPLDVLFVTVPLSFLMASLPVSIGGLGVREGTIIFLLARFGVPVEQGAALAAVYLSVLVVVTAPSGLLILRKSPALNMAHKH